MNTNKLQIVAKKISNSMIFPHEKKLEIKEKLSRGKMTKEELKEILEALQLEPQIKKTLKHNLKR